MVNVATPQNPRIYSVEWYDESGRALNVISRNLLGVTEKDKEI